MTPAQRIVKNILAGGISTAVGGLLQLATVLVIARQVSVAQFGLYTFMVTLGFVLQRLSDMGVSPILMRDLAVKPEKTGELLGQTLSLAWLISSAVTLLMFGAIPFLHFDYAISILTALMGVGGLWQLQCGCYGAVLRAREDNELYALGFLLHKVILMVLVVAALQARTALPGIVVAHLLANLFQWWFYRWIVIQRYARPRLRINLVFWRYLFTNAVPVGAAGVVRLLGEQADITILTWLTDLRRTGLYSGSYKLTAGLRFVPQAMVIALFPAYSRAAEGTGSKHVFHEIYERGVRGFVLLAFPVALLFLVEPGLLTRGLLGIRYAAAAPAMRLLGIGVWLFFVASPFPFLLTALNEQRFLFVSSAVATALRVLLDLSLTPFFGFLGPCLALIACETLLVAMWVGRLWSLGFALPLVGILWRPCLASLVMAAMLYFSHAQSLLMLIPVALISAAAYLALVIKLGAVSGAELEMAREGMDFVRPLFAEWARQARTRP